MWLPDVMTSTPEARIASAVDGRQAHPAGDVLAVGRDEVDAALLAELRQDLLDRDPAGLADHVADHQHAAGARRPGRVAVGRVAEARRRRWRRAARVVVMAAWQGCGGLTRKRAAAGHHRPDSEDSAPTLSGRPVSDYW